MRACFVWAAVATGLVVLSGCGGGDAAPSGGAGAAAVDASKPLAGKAVGKTSQLAGTWVYASDGDYVGFEFMDEGKALVTSAMAAVSGGLNSGVMMTYDVLDGGRLSLTGPGGQTQVYGVTIAGDQLELKGSMPLSRKDGQRFIRLPKGQTLAQGVAEKELAEAQRRQKQYEALRALLEKPDLVIVPTDNRPGGPVAIAFVAQVGTAWHDDSPPHMDAITVQVDQGDRGGDPAVSVRFGPQLQPAVSGQQPSRGGAIRFLPVVGDDGMERLIAKVNYGGASTELELKTDATLHAAVVDRFKAELARIEALKKPLIDALRDYARLGGTSGSANTRQPPNTDRIELVRDDKGGYRGEGVSATPSGAIAEALTPIQGQVLVINDKAVLQLDAPRRMYQLSLGDNGKLTGGWYPRGSGNGWQAELMIEEATDAAELARRIEARHKALASLSPATPLAGVMSYRGGGATADPRVPVVLTLKPDGGGGFDALVDYVTEQHVIQMKGTLTQGLTGPRVGLRFVDVDPSSPKTSNLYLVKVRNVRYDLAPVPTDRGVELIGDGGQGVTVTAHFVEATDAWRAAQRAAVVEALGGGATLGAVRPDRANIEPTRLKVRLDAATGQISGAWVSGGRHLEIKPKPDFPIVGQLVDSPTGWPTLRLNVNQPPDSRDRSQWQLDMLAWPEGKTLRLVGSAFVMHAPQTARDFELEPVPE